MLKMAGYSMHVAFWMYQFQWHRSWDCTIRCFWVMGYMYALCQKLPITGTTFRIFCNITQNTTPEENSQKMSHISSQIGFSLGRLRIFWGDKDQISSGEDKWKGQEGGMGEKPKIRVIFLENSHYYARYKLYLTNCWSNFNLPPLRLAWWKTNKQGLSSDFEQFFLVKTTLYILENKYGFQMGNSMEKINYFDEKEIGNAMEKINSIWFSLSTKGSPLLIFLSQHLMQVFDCRAQHSICRVNYRWPHSIL